jgi:hypothetical protein
MSFKRYGFAISAVAVSLLFAFSAWAQEGETLVFGSHAELRKMGIEVAKWGPKGGEDLPVKCGASFGGDGMYDFSFSHQFVDKFKKRGFTTLSLCMGMGSEIRYNPETGARLPAFILADIPAIRRNAVEAGTLTEQVPYDLPDCFRNALPLEDCKLNFDMKTGRRLTAQQSSKLKQGGPIANSIQSSLLPKGHGYILYNEGPAGPEASNETLKIVKMKR